MISSSTNAKSGLWAVGLALLTATATQAAIDPENFRQGTPEGVVIQVMASRSVTADDITQVHLAAKILEVIWSATDLKAGDLILIVYRQDHARYKKDREDRRKRINEGGWTGPQVLSSPPVLKAGDVHMAHLGPMEDENSTGKVYTPQAYQYSFGPEAAKEQYRRQSIPPDLYRPEEEK